MSTARDARARTWPPRRWAVWGFIAGAAIAVPATFFALLSHTGETVHPYLVPSSALLRRLPDLTATWPDVINVAIAAVVNGIMYAAGAGVLGSLLAIPRYQ